MPTKPRATRKVGRPPKGRDDPQRSAEDLAALRAHTAMLSKMSKPGGPSVTGEGVTPDEIQANRELRLRAFRDQLGPTATRMKFSRAKARLGGFKNLLHSKTDTGPAQLRQALGDVLAHHVGDDPSATDPKALGESVRVTLGYMVLSIREHREQPDWQLAGYEGRELLKVVRDLMPKQLGLADAWRRGASEGLGLRNGCDPGLLDAFVKNKL